MFGRLMTPLVAVGLAFLVWLYTHRRNQEVIDLYEVPVEIKVHPDQARDYELMTVSSSRIPVSFSGPPSRMRELRQMLQDGEIRLQRMIAVPEERLGENRYSTVERFQGSDLSVPPWILPAISRGRNEISVTLQRMLEKELQVQFRHDGAERVQEVVIEPSTVLVRGPKEVLDRTTLIPTRPYAIPQRRDATEAVVLEEPIQVPLVDELNGVPVRATPARVSVRFTLKPRQRVTTVPKVPVRFLSLADFPYRPRFQNPEDAEITLTVVGPAEIQRRDVIAYVDLTAPRNFRAGIYRNEPIQVQLPAGFRLAEGQESPRLKAFELVPIEGAETTAGSPETSSPRS